jgi:hypothetical protein
MYAVDHRVDLDIARHHLDTSVKNRNMIAAV